MTACGRPGCEGAIDETDGVCDTCFLGPENASRAGTPCGRPNCLGTIEDDGTCDTCFLEAEEARTSTAFDTLARSPLWYRTAWDGEPDLALELPTAPPVRPAGQLGPEDGLGLGLVKIPPILSRDPRRRLLTDPVVPERDRICRKSGCGVEIGRTVAEVPGAVEGRCPNCETPFSFRPPLDAGDRVGQYRIAGCVGRGGQGWVYLAYDENLDDEPVALKGLRDTGSRHALAEEKRTLIAVRHPGIVDIRNFVERQHPVTGAFDGYIVLEFLDGASLADKRRAAGSPLPVPEAVAYVLATLPALGYLHDSGLVYRDFKPDNVMQVGSRIKLVDMGAVSRAGPGRQLGRSWATPGFAAPEVRGGFGPTAASDLFSVGRTLAALSADFDLLGEPYASAVPGPDSEAAFAQHESFYRFLYKATAEDPGRRFTSAALMAEQLAGVLREVTALAPVATVRPASRPSALFTGERGTLSTDLHRPPEPLAATRALPVPRPDESDPGAAFLATVTAAEPAQLVRELKNAPWMTPDVAFRLVLAHIALGETKAARSVLDGLKAVGERDWRRIWYRGLIDLGDGEPQSAWRAFAAVRDNLPGELAPKLALAVCAEALGTFTLARHYYHTVWRTDDAFVGAAFGVARTYRLDSAERGVEHAVAVLENIPDRLHHHLTARMQAVRLRLEREDLDPGQLREAAQRLQALGLDEDGEPYLKLRALMFEVAGRLLPAGGESLLGVAARGEAIGRELERVYLALRHTAPTRRDRVALVKRAHAARPKTRW